MAILTKPASVNSDTTASDSIIDVRRVVKKFEVGDSEITVLKEVTFNVKPGEFVSVVGPSGSGKSTLLNMFTGIDRPTNGEVEVNGTCIDKLSENQLAKWRGQNLGIVFQFFQMLPALTILDNVVLPMDFAGKYSRRERKERAMHLLEMVGLEDQANKLPGMVSGGQQQRSAIARALANDPPIIVGDEPTGNLDSVSTELIFEMFLKLIDEGKTLVMVTHNPEIAHRTPRVVEIADGRIIRDENLRRITM